MHAQIFFSFSTLDAPDAFHDLELARRTFLVFWVRRGWWKRVFGIRRAPNLAVADEPTSPVSGAVSVDEKECFGSMMCLFGSCGNSVSHFEHFAHFLVRRVETNHFKSSIFWMFFHHLSHSNLPSPRSKNFKPRRRRRWAHRWAPVVKYMHRKKISGSWRTTSQEIWWMKMIHRITEF